MIGWLTSGDLRELGDALDLLATLRADHGVVPGAHWDTPKINLVGRDRSWELEWVEGDDDNVGHYKISPEAS